MVSLATIAATEYFHSRKTTQWYLSKAASYMNVLIHTFNARAAAWSRTITIGWFQPPSCLPSITEIVIYSVISDAMTVSYPVIVCGPVAYPLVLYYLWYWLLSKWRRRQSIGNIRSREPVPGSTTSSWTSNPFSISTRFELHSCQERLVENGTISMSQIRVLQQYPSQQKTNFLISTKKLEACWKKVKTESQSTQSLPFYCYYYWSKYSLLCNQEVKYRNLAKGETELNDRMRRSESTSNYALVHTFESDSATSQAALEWQLL